MNSSARAWTFLLAFSVLLLIVGHLLAGREGVLWSVVVSLSINSIIYFYGDQWLRGIYRGRTLEGQDPWGLNETVTRISQKARIPRPSVIILEREAPQAFSFGRNWRSGTLVLTEGLLNHFTREELEAIVAYQIASIQRMDTLMFSVASCFCGALLFCTQTMDLLVRWLVGAKKGGLQSQLFTYAFSPLAALVLRLCVNPRHYFAIDTLAAQWVSQPKTLANVLWKLQSYSSTVPFSAPAFTAHFFMVNPLTANGWTRYFRVQPSVERRIKKLVGYFPL